MIGVSLILVVFIILCLVTFATLAFVLSNTDSKLSKSAAENITQFYEADARAQETLQQIDSILEKSYLNTSTQEEYVALIQDEIVKLREDNNATQVEGAVLKQIEMVIEDDRCILRFVTDASIHEQIVSVIEINYPVQQSYYRIIEWALESKK